MGIPPGTELHMHFDELDFVDHACLDFIAAFQERQQETGGKVVMEWLCRQAVWRIVHFATH